MPSVVELFSRKMPRKAKTKLPALENEPKIIRPRGPPPPYQPQPYFVDVEDGATTVSEYSYHRSQTPPAFNPLGKRRSSWSNLMESDENLHRPSNVVTSQHNGHLAVYKPIALSEGRLRYTSTPSANCTDGKTQQLYVPSSNVSSTASEFILVPKKAMKLNVENSISRRLTFGKEFKLFGACTTKMLLLWLIVAILLTLLVTIVVVIIRQAVMPPSAYSYTWLPPQQLSGDKALSSKLYMKVGGENQVEFELKGNLPFKSESRSVIDFATGNIAVIDHALKHNGKNLVCFLLKLNMTNIPDVDILRQAARNALSINAQKTGWHESWQFVPEPLDTRQTAGLFSPPIPQCHGVRWIVLKQTPVNQQAMKCSQCYDFCLPEYGVESDRVGNFNYLNIIRRDCFYLFVPEWREFAQAYNAQQNQQDFEQFYNNQRVSTGPQVAGQKPLEPKWIPVQQQQQQTPWQNGAEVANGNGAQNFGPQLGVGPQQGIGPQLGIGSQQGIGPQPGFSPVATGYQQRILLQPGNSVAVQQNFPAAPAYGQIPQEGGGRNGRFQPSTTGAPPSAQQSVPNGQSPNALNSNAKPIPYNNGQGWIRVGSGGR